MASSTRNAAWASRLGPSRARPCPGGPGGPSAGGEIYGYWMFEGSLEVKLPTIWTDEKQRWEEPVRREEYVEERR